jgi:flagellar M-ring protein FliF
MLVVTGGGLVALALLLYSWSSSTNFVTLYSGLDASDSGRIVDQLRSRGVPFSIEAGGTTVSVAQSDVDELRLDFAAQGLPAGGHVGFELFDGNGFALTDFAQRLNFQRGLQGELARTIETFSAVERARVHIVLPERSLFVADQRPATASVVLQMRPGRALGSSEVAGVAHLISGAVEGLDKESIVIVDTSGGVLFDGRDLEEGTGIGASSSQLALQRTYEQAIELGAQQLLDQALGPGKSAVSVRAILNFDRLETETETFTPGIGGDQVQRSSTTVTETYSTTGDASTGAVPGAVANIPGADTSLPLPAGSSETSESGSGTDYARTESTSNFEVGRTVTRSVQAVGGVERLSVSLLLDDSITEEQATALMEAVSAAAGVDADRGDTIVVSRLPFDRAAVEDAQAAFAAEASTAQILGYVRIALPVLVLAVAFFFFRMLMRSVNAHSAYRLVEAPQGMLAAPDGSMPVALPQVRSGGAPLPPPPAPEDMQSQVEQQVTRLAENSPDAVANVVQSWLREE